MLKINNFLNDCWSHPFLLYYRHVIGKYVCPNVLKGQTFITLRTKLLKPFCAKSTTLPHLWLRLYYVDHTYNLKSSKAKWWRTWLVKSETACRTNLFHTHLNEFITIVNCGIIIALLLITNVRYFFFIVKHTFGSWWPCIRQAIIYILRIQI